MSFTNHLRVLLQLKSRDLIDRNLSPGLSDEDISQIIQISVPENIDLGCSLIRKAVQEKAIEDIILDATITEAVDIRRQ